MGWGRIEYTELARAKISSSRNIVISKCSKGGFTMAQQLEAEEGNKTTAVFLKGAFHIDGVDELYNLRDAINLAILLFKESEPKVTWDEQE